MRLALPLLPLVAACNGAPVVADSDTPGDTEIVDTDPGEQPPVEAEVVVLVTLDGAPVEGATVSQGGGSARWTTGPDGKGLVKLDSNVQGEIYIVAAHPEARTKGGSPGEGELTIALTRYDPSDNPDYVFQHPGTPDIRDSTEYCSHCHVTIDAAWYASPHRTTANNPTVQDLYAGVAAAFADQASCEAQGGRWLEGITPGTQAPGWRCYVGDGALPALNADCASNPPCDGRASEFGACADCHAPGIDGQLGGRDLLEATGIAYDYGVHCDVCHRVDAVDPAAPAGVGGRLVLTRPSEPSPSPGLGDYLPLTFGPYGDVSNIRMGAVGREHFHDGSLCSGCHELDQAVLVDGASIDAARWPTGTIPVHSTYSEWQAGPYGSAGVACPACHMPPDASVGNASDLGNEFDLEPSAASGWYRPAGSVREHAWYGPRQPESGMLRLAATVEIEKSVSAGEVTADVSVRNVGCGHALPTGEPLRSVVLLVEASCGSTLLQPVGGSAVPDFGGWLDRKESGEDWAKWPGASVGDVVRVVRRTGAWWDYVGHGPFGDGTFDPAAKGMPVEDAVGEATIVAIAGDVASFDRTLPAGDVAYRGRGAGLPADGEPITPRAGAPGFAFARVLVAPDGRRMVPHFLAVDVASDNRLLPQQTWTSTHRFATTCEDPQVRAVLLHRPLPPELASERAYDVREAVMAEVTR
jgi:hypothetical protein